MKTAYMNLTVLAAVAGCCALGCSKPKGDPAGATASEPGEVKLPDGSKDGGEADEFVAGSKADMFTMALAADPETFDTAKMSGAPEGRIAFNLFEGLYMPGPTTEAKDELVVPGVASQHTLSEDGKTYTFTIRDGAKWSNGRQVSAEDFVYSWKRILTPGFEADYVTFLYLIEGAAAYNKGGGDWDSVGIKAT
ncbi:MAG: ABC transporter substrate-binding protein, partial [Myxococcota bacterium]